MASTPAPETGPITSRPEPDSNKKLAFLLLALVLGGALGNLYDRIVLGHVVDFILVHWQSRWFFPAFNLADTFITIGAILLALDMFKSDKSAKEAAQ